MGKFFRLVQNEHIKIFTRISTWVLIILMAVVSIGFTGLMKLIEYQNNNVVYTDDYKESYEREIQYLKSDKSEGYEIQIERYEFLIAQDINPYGTWQYEAASTQFDRKASLLSQAELGGITEAELETGLKEIDACLKQIADKDWKGYYQRMIAENNTDPTLSAAQKEANNYYYSYLVQNNIDPDSKDWRISLVDQIQSDKTSLLAIEQVGTLNGEQQEQAKGYQERILMNEHRLEHNLKAVAGQVSFDSYAEIDFWTVMGSSNVLIGVVSMIVIIMAGSSIANEFSTGTIKFLLINPVKRWKIFLSKYVTIISMSVMLVLCFFFLNTFLSGILFGFGDIAAPYLYLSGDTVRELPGILFTLWQYLIGSVNLIVMGTLAFAISSLMRNSAVAIGISVFAMLAGNTMVTFLGTILQQDWARFFIFANTDLNAIMTGTSIFPNMTVGFSLCVIAVHMVIFFLTAWDGFMRRESI
ncbi:MAG: ABC transporter permease subunit [Oscillospiraceae bacterium]|nr:ABC transporter permease subunit [Oscillospiraceae bacterium]